MDSKSQKIRHFLITITKEIAIFHIIAIIFKSTRNKHIKFPSLRINDQV